MRNIALLMYRANAVVLSSALPGSSSISTSSPFSLKSGKRPYFMLLIAGNTRCDITSKICRGSLFLNLLHRMDWPGSDGGKILGIASPVIFSNSSLSSSFSSRERINMRYVSCSMTVSGLAIPPAQMSVQILSTLFLIAPVIIVAALRYLVALLRCFCVR